MINLPANLVQQIINYLTSKPWGEANSLIVEIMKHVPKQEPKVEEKKEDAVQK